MRCTEPSSRTSQTQQLTCVAARRRLKITAIMETISTNRHAWRTFQTDKKTSGNQLIINREELQQNILQKNARLGKSLWSNLKSSAMLYKFILTADWII